jgi:citrate synthase
VEEGVQVSADQAADLLGVRLQTIYAYVSRGLLTRSSRSTGTGHRVSLFRLDEVLRLAAERTRVRTGSLEVLVETDVTLLDPKGTLTFRGHDAVALTARPFEDVAELLWSAEGVLAAHDPHRWVLPPPVRERVARVCAGLGAGATDLDRVRAAVLVLACDDPRRADLDREHVAAVGRRCIIGGVTALPLRQNEIGGWSVERLLWPRLTDRPATDEALAALRAALVLLVDHELAASTMAVRVAAGTGADAYLLLLTGLAALGGPLHGRSSLRAEQLLAGALRQDADPAKQDEVPPGFGHKVYVDADPRAEALLDRVARLDPDAWPPVEELLLDVSRRHGLSPNVDLALAALVRACGLTPGSGETVFGISRMVGWLAHGLEESPRGLRFRGRAVYTGEPTGRDVGDADAADGHG